MNSRYIMEALQLVEDDLMTNSTNENSELQFKHHEDTHGSYDYYDLGYVNGVKCSATYYYKWLRDSDFYTVNQHRPYDDAEYYWALSHDGRNWQIILNRRIQNNFISEFKDFVSVAKYIVSLSKDIKQKMMHN